MVAVAKVDQRLHVAQRGARGVELERLLVIGVAVRSNGSGVVQGTQRASRFARMVSLQRDDLF